jgi:ribosomal protein S12 methylthiotransferase accessory factor
MRTGGKGVDADAARVAAVSEAVERTALGWPADVPVVRASLAELGERTLDPREILLFSTQQYERQAREPSEAATLAGTDAVIRHRVPLPLTVDDPLEWVSAFPLSGFATTGEPSGVGGDRLVPAALVWFGHRAEGPDPTHDSDRIVADSNGVAAGATATEAAVYALLEVIERDAVAMWWHLRLARSQLDLDSCDDDYLHNVADHCRTAGRYLWLLDLTNDLGVPVVAAVSPKVDGSEVVFGFGAHLDPVQAARAAAAECAQFLVGFERATGADRHGLFGEPGRRWWGTRTLATDPYLKPTGTARWPPDRSGPNQLADLSVLCEQLEKAGLFAFAVPLSRPDVPELAVIRVIVPGARPMFPRFAPGRLFEVPHRLGWTSHRLGEADVNPEEIFF